MIDPGDLIFVRPSKGDFVGRLVASKTNGPFSHVRFVVNSAYVLESLVPSGITLSNLSAEPRPEDMAHVGHTLEKERLNHALAWGEGLAGHARYGGLDILADIVSVVLPQQLGGRTPFLIAASQYDCSDFATRMLMLAGYMWLPDPLYMDPSRISPNALARALGVIA